MSNRFAIGFEVSAQYFGVAGKIRRYMGTHRVIKYDA